MKIENKMIFSQRVAQELMELGFIPNQILPNPYNPKFNCWLFDWNEEFAQALTSITKEKKANEIS